jgi:hypothetical protein
LQRRAARSGRQPPCCRAAHQRPAPPSTAPATSRRWGTHTRSGRLRRSSGAHLGQRQVAAQEHHQHAVGEVHVAGAQLAQPVVQRRVAAPDVGRQRLQLSADARLADREIRARQAHELAEAGKGDDVVLDQDQNGHLRRQQRRQQRRRVAALCQGRAAGPRLAKACAGGHRTSQARAPAASRDLHRRQTGAGGRGGGAGAGAGTGGGAGAVVLRCAAPTKRSDMPWQ